MARLTAAEERMRAEKRQREKEAAIRSFVATTGIEAKVAVEFLQRAEWRLEDALGMFNATKGGSKVDPEHAAADAAASTKGGSTADLAATDASGPSATAETVCPTAVESKAQVNGQRVPRDAGNVTGPSPAHAEKKYAIRSFLDVTSPRNFDVDMATHFLERAQWHVEDAIKLFFAMEGESSAADVALRLPPPSADNTNADKEIKSSSVDCFVMEPIGSKIKRHYRLNRSIYDGLKSYQKEGLLWFWNVHCSNRGGILGDDMGLGKTRQVAAFLSGLFESDLVHRCLITVPPILMDQWVKELKVVGLSKDTHIFRDQQRKKRSTVLQEVVKNGGLLLCSTGLLSKEWKNLGSFGKWDYIIIDEAHTLSNPKTQKFKALNQILCSHRVLVTGTPIQNNLKELHALLDFCCPGILGTIQDFQKKFLLPIVDGNFKGSTNEELMESSQAAAKLRTAIRPYMLRRTKTEINLPEKTEFTVWLEPTPYQQKLYKTFLETNTFKRAPKGTVVVACKILQKICNHPCKLSSKEAGERELDKDQSALLRNMVQKLHMNVPIEQRDDNEFNFSCKIECIMKLLERFHGQHKVLIFAQTREMLDEIEGVLLKKDYEFLRIDGTTEASERKDVVEKFKKEGGPEIFLLSTRVGGVGLDLPVASRAIIVDPAWNPSTDNQCADRIYRIGQVQNVFVYRLIARKTVEQYIYETQLFKSGLFKLTTENADCKRYITKEMKNELLKVPENFSPSEMQKKLVKESMKDMRSEKTQNEMNELEKSGFGKPSIHNNLFSETIELPHNSRMQNITSRTGRRYDPDYVVGGESYSFKPDDPVATSLAKERRIAALKCEIQRCSDVSTTGSKHLEQLQKELQDLQAG